MSAFPQHHPRSRLVTYGGLLGWESSRGACRYRDSKRYNSYVTSAIEDHRRAGLSNPRSPHRRNPSRAHQLRPHALRSLANPWLNLSDVHYRWQLGLIESVVATGYQTTGD